MNCPLALTGFVRRVNPAVTTLALAPELRRAVVINTPVVPALRRFASIADAPLAADFCAPTAVRSCPVGTRFLDRHLLANSGNSLGRHHRRPVQPLSLVATQLDQPSQRVRAIIQMTTSLELVTIAEGVESESTESL